MATKEDVIKRQITEVEKEYEAARKEDVSFFKKKNIVNRLLYLMNELEQILTSPATLNKV